MTIMKNIVKISTLSLVLVFSGCNFFNNSSPSTSSSDVIFGSVAKTEGAVAAVYELFGEDRSYHNRLITGYAGLNTDIEFHKNTEAKGWANYTITPNDADLSDAKGRDPWGYLNSMIERCNNIVIGINAYGYASAQNKADSAAFDYLKGEALFLRSFALLEKVKYWGDVPVSTVPFDGYDMSLLDMRKVDRNVAFEQIRSDLKEAANLMNWSENVQIERAKNDVRRPSKAAALALLARADLMYAGKAVRPTVLAPGVSDYKIDFNIDPAKRAEIYQEVMWACDSVIRHDDATKWPLDFEQVFKDICADKIAYSSMEQIWVIPFANGSRGQLLNYNCAKFNTAKDKGADFTIGILLHNKDYEPEVKSNCSLRMMPMLLFDYEVGDKRRDVTVLPYKWSTSTRGQVDPNASSLSRSEKSKVCLYPALQANVSEWSCGKYRIEWMARDNTSQNDGLDFPVIRYADVLLMFAEASIGSVDNTPQAPAYATQLTGQEAFDKVRARAGLTSKTLDLNAIKAERKFEFAGEYLRKWDLMRWGVLRDSVKAANDRLVYLVETYANDGRTLYMKYALDASNTYLQDGAISYENKAVNYSYKIDERYGFSWSETGSKTGSAWLKANCEFEKRYNEGKFKFYYNEEDLDRKQYWPIFSNYVGASGGVLYNNYGY